MALVDGWDCRRKRMDPGCLPLRRAAPAPRGQQQRSLSIRGHREPFGDPACANAASNR